ncbi:XdhC family protein [Luteimonas sp. M1R5S18]|uniref:XdhC family protein n=1 Tax=Luteimonas rhizosphaericola TaxID=3042024 RepID=A0ABT6JHL6_9GAMM|nr:XdhC/CoxI family protein [Luteimonas rhizosphaericola]MDH5830163.1 XdhC family protein [Luteimonas rhizosphaericola]
MTPAGGAGRFLARGNPRPVLEAALACARQRDAALALVLETEGSTYARAGAMALFAGEREAGWLSGGCLEPELARRAAAAAADGRIGWIEIDTRDDEALFSGAALGCRGRLRIALLPLAAMDGVEAVLRAWIDGSATLERTLSASGEVALRAGDRSGRWTLPTDAPGWDDAAAGWSLPLPPLPELLLLGAGPESPALLRLLRELGWRTVLVEDRARWRKHGAMADAHLTAFPVPLNDAAGQPAAALVMHHDFERDRDALDALAGASLGFIGLLGPPRRRDDLLVLLPPARRDALAGRLRAPVGLDLGGQGPEAIALSIAAQLQQWRAAAGDA